jgi:adenylosuccinate synthase
VATRYAAIINGIDELAVTNLDGLDNVETIKVCIGYRAGLARLITCRRTLSCWPSASRFMRNFPAG